MVPLLLWGPVILALAVFGIRQVGSLVAVGLMAAGYLLWILTEYWVHRAVFHFGSFGDAPALPSRPTRIADPLAAL